MILFGFLFPIASAQGTFSKPLGKSFKSQTIICAKGKAIKKVSGAKPSCPTGYKQKVALKNRIAFSLLPSYAIGGGLIDLPRTSSASLLVSYQSNTPLICSISQNQVRLIAPGKCRIMATQQGARFVDKAVPVTVSFNVIGQNSISVITPFNDAKIGDQQVGYQVAASSGLAVSGESLDPSVCNLGGDKIQFIHIGLCQIRWSQSGNAFYSVADPVVDRKSTRLNSSHQ